MRALRALGPAYGAPQYLRRKLVPLILACPGVLGPPSTAGPDPMRLTPVPLTPAVATAGLPVVAGAAGLTGISVTDDGLPARAGADQGTAARPIGA